MTTYEKTKDLQVEAAEVINSNGWRHSWHWDTDEHGALTLKGWRQAREDGFCNAAFHRKRAEKIEAFLPNITRAIQEMSEMEKSFS